MKLSKKFTKILVLLVFILGVTIFINRVHITSRFSYNPVIEEGKLSIISGEQYKNWKTYVNYNFNYLVRFPENWQEGKIADNGDGRVLYHDELGNEITIYGSYVTWPHSVMGAPIESGLVVLNDGRKVSYRKSNYKGQVEYLVFFNEKGIGEDTEVQYGLNVKVSEQFFKENEQTIEDVARSIEVLNLVY